ncbi:MAG: NAD(P)-dependent oxidoreductase [Bacteroidota bacterium]
MNISFIGLGIMGQRMAANLLKQGHELSVFNRSQAATEALVEQGAKTAATLAEVVKDADVVLSMLSTPEVVETVMWKQALPHLKRGALWVDSSTVNPSFSRASATKAQELSIRFLDAPVAGTKPHAEQGQLTFFVGGEAADLEAVRPLLASMGQKVLHLGAAGKGSAFKMLVNSLLAQSMLVFSETLHLGQRMGLDKEFLLNTLPNLVVSAPFTKAKAEMIRTGDYEVQFPLEWMHKDLHLATLCAYEEGLPLPMAALAKEIFSQAKEKGLGRKDFAAIYESLSDESKA